MASVLVRAFDLKEDSAKNSLSKVKDSNQLLPGHRQDVKVLYDLGITNGKGNGKYAPKDSITRVEYSNKKKKRNLE